MIREALTVTRGVAGRRRKMALDDSAQAREKTLRLAVARAQNGDQEAIRFLYVNYAHNVYGYVHSIVHDGHEAEDLTQHVFAKLMTAITKYNPTAARFWVGAAAPRRPTPAEIAQRLGRSKSSVHSLHHRGRRALQSELARLDSAPFTHRTGHFVAA